MSKQHLHEKLNITFQELGALLGARNMLATGLVTETPTTTPVDGEHEFNMSTKCKRQGCGTVTCIGGLMALIMGKRPVRYVDEFGGGEDECSRPLVDLFYPPQAPGWDWITPQIAAMAIDNFLHDGDPKWRDLNERYDNGQLKG